MTDCEKYIELISCLVDGELSKEQEAELRAHIEVCPECRRVYDAFSAVFDALESDIAEVPEGLAKGIMYRIGKTQKTSKPHFFAFGRFTAVAACLVLILFGASKLGLFQPKGQSSGDTALRSTFDTEKSTSASGSEESGSEENSGMQLTDGSTEFDETALEYGQAVDPVCAEVQEELSEKLRAGDVEIYEGEEKNEKKLVTVNGETQADSLLAILGCSYVDEELDLSDTPDYTLVFSDGTSLLVWFGDGEITCQIEDGLVFHAFGLPEDLTNYLDDALSDD